MVSQAFLDGAFTADIAIQNAGGCRTDFLPGDFTISKAVDLLPFKNTIVTLKMTGAQIVLLLNQAAQSAFTSSTGAYPYGAGIRYEVDQNAQFPNIVSNVEINVRLAQAEWTPIIDTQIYTVVTNSFAASGGDGYLAFADVPDEDVTDLFLEYALALIDYARKVKVLNDPPLSTYSTQKFFPLGTNRAPTTSAPSTPSTPTSAPMSPTSAPTLRKKKGKDKKAPK